MKKIFFLILIILFTCLSIPASAQWYATDIIVTSPDGIWTDSRAYNTLNDAITAVGANDREVVIASPQTVTTLTVPSNVRLKFLRDGSITNSGYLNIQTKNIEADNRQIFTGVGNIDFAIGTVLKTGWFSNIETAFALTTNDSVTLIVSKPQTITANYSPGNNVHLKWDSPGNILTVSAGRIVGNLKNIEAGNYQLFGGTGDFDFLDGTELKLNWFNQLSSVLTWVENEEVTIIVNEDSLVQASVATAANENIKVLPGGKLNLDAGVVLTLNSQIEAGPYQIFSGLGTVVNNSSGISYDKWTAGGIDDVIITNYAKEYSPNYLEVDQGATGNGKSVKAYIDAIGASNATIFLNHNSGAVTTTYTFSTDETIPSNINVVIEKGAIISIANAITLTINSPFEVGLYKIFTLIGTGKALFGTGSLGSVLVNWFGFEYGTNNAAQATTNLAAITAAEASLGTDGGIVQFPRGIFVCDPGITPTHQKVEYRGAGTTWNINTGDMVESGTTLVFTTGSYGFDLGVDSTQHGTRIYQIMIDGNGVLNYGIRIASLRIIEDVLITRTLTAGIWIEDYMNSTHIDKVSIVDNTGIGILIAGENSTTGTFRRLLLQTGTIGVSITGCNGITIQDSTIEHFTTAGISIYKPTGRRCDAIAVMNNYIEDNGGAAGYNVILDSQSYGTTTQGPNNITFFNNVVAAGEAGQNIYNLNSGRYIEFINDTPINLGAANYTRAAATQLNDVVWHPHPAWITPAYAAGDFTASGAMTWTVEAGDITTYKYELNGKTMRLSFSLHDTVVDDTPATQLLVKIPEGKTANSSSIGILMVYQGAAWVMSKCNIDSGETSIKLFPAVTGGNWLAAPTTTNVQGYIEFEVQ